MARKVHRNDSGFTSSAHYRSDAIPASSYSQTKLVFSFFNHPPFLHLQCLYTFLAWITNPRFRIIIVYIKHIHTTITIQDFDFSNLSHLRHIPPDFPTHAGYVIQFHNPNPFMVECPQISLSLV